MKRRPPQVAPDLAPEPRLGEYIDRFRAGAGDLTLYRSNLVPESENYTVVVRGVNGDHDKTSLLELAAALEDVRCAIRCDMLRRARNG